MILTIDIGNTNISIGLYKNNQLISTKWIKTQKNLKSNDCLNILKKNFPTEKPQGVIICSVVPYLTEQFKELFIKNFNLEPIILRHNLNLGIKFDYENKETLGSDRIANVVAAYHLYKKGCIVIDLGTAITFDVISPEGIYLGGAIAPGIETSSKALFASADLLKPVEIKNKEFRIGKNTTESLQIGIIHGFASMLEGMVENFKGKIEFTPLIILTGGDAEKMGEKVNFSHIVNLFLTLEGLRIIYEKNLS